LTSQSTPLSVKLRAKAKKIAELLEEYVILRYGDKDYRLGDEVYRNSGGKEGNPPGKCGKPPKIVVISTPRSIFQSEENPKERSANLVLNPLLQAVTDMGEIDKDTALYLQLENRYNIIRGMGINERMNCSALFPWIRKMAAQITYILETRELYSTEIKAIYPELLNDLEIARATCDELAAKLLHYAKIAQQAALQLADHHESFMSEEISPLERGPETEWVFQEELPPKQLKKPESEG